MLLELLNFLILSLVPSKINIVLFLLCQHIYKFFVQVYDEDIGQDKRLGIAKLPLLELESETTKEIQLRLQPSLDMLKIKDKKDRGTLTVKVHIKITLLNFHI